MATFKNQYIAYKNTNFLLLWKIQGCGNITQIITWQQLVNRSFLLWRGTGFPVCHRLYHSSCVPSCEAKRWFQYISDLSLLVLQHLFNCRYGFRTAWSVFPSLRVIKKDDVFWYSYILWVFTMCQAMFQGFTYIGMHLITFQSVMNHICNSGSIRL